MLISSCSATEPRKIVISSLPRAVFKDKKNIERNFGILLSVEHKNALSCLECSSLYQSPITLQCGHSFCLSCLKDHYINSRLCPTCNLEITKTFLCDSLTQATKTVKVVCLQQRKVLGTDEPDAKRLRLTYDDDKEYCESVLLWEHVRIHIEKQCPYLQIDCRYCGDLLHRYLMKEHEAKCLHNPIFKTKCDVCYTLIPKSLAEKHRDICPMEIIRCNFHGCERMLPRPEMVDHQRNDFLYHYDIIRQSLDKNEAIIAKLESKIEAMEKEKTK